MFDALKAGTLDGLMVNIDSGYMLKVHEPAPYVLASKHLWLGHLYILAMNSKTWEGLATEDKAAIQRAAEAAYKTLGQVMDDSFDAMVRDMVNEGVKIRLLQQKEVDAFEAAVKYRDVQAGWVKKQEGKGVKDAGQTVEKVRAALTNVLN